ncbi:membrane protein [Streptomyces sp. PRh5]|uniref:LolA family protein n=1 Tax=Streptomyces sp. PRh5 TaxID=1158056 RepID=UPI00044FF8DD|nr:sigma-E factor regulatory protein RseB domain-containing protein [Streptomyces sp. PRh5]EXU65911.1 membrane protein [Streptomyces sp. PRh5]
MARIRPTQVADDGFWDEERPSRGKKAARYAAPVAVAGIAAATIGLVPALASTGDPNLPKISAQELISKMAASDAQQMSGSVKITTDLGIPSLPGGGSIADLGGAQGGDASAAPESKLMELISGSHTLRVASDGPDKQRVSIVENAAEYSMIHNGGEIWAYDSGSNSAYHATAPKDAKAKGDHRREVPKDLRDVTPQEMAKTLLSSVDDTTDVTVDGTSRVAGRDAYDLLIKPKQNSDSTIGSVRIAVDADNGVPLKFTLSPKSGGKAIVDVGFTNVDFGKPKASTFDFTPPKGAKVTEEPKADHKNAPKGFGGKDFKDARSALSGLKVVGEGWDSVARLDTPGGAAAPETPGGDSGPGAASGLLGGFGKEVKGKFGSGTVISTRLVNALLTEDGKVFVGAVDKDALVKAANAAK